MPLFDIIPSTYEEAVEALARWHGESFDFPVRIYSVPDPARQQVRLIEVSDQFPRPVPALPIPLGRSKSFPFKSSVAMATESEWEDIQTRRIHFPPDWDLRQAKLVWPHD